MTGRAPRVKVRHGVPFLRMMLDALMRGGVKKATSHGIADTLRTQVFNDHSSKR
jgi:hypothetical protein